RLIGQAAVGHDYGNRAPPPKGTAQRPNNVLNTNRHTHTHTATPTHTHTHTHHSQQILPPERVNEHGSPMPKPPSCRHPYVVCMFVCVCVCVCVFVCVWWFCWCVCVCVALVVLC